MKSLGERNVLLPLWLGSAAIVTVARFFQPADPNYDLGVQLQAAHNLLAGRGLTTFSELGPNLSQPNVLVPLTYFPAGYSLAAATFASVGLDVATTLKVLGAVATMLGWWGWARLAQSFMGEVVARPLWKWAASAIAVSTPLLFTQPWGGTDIFLWAVVPWVIECTVTAANEKTREAWKFDWLAGTLCAFVFLMRYASSFLVVYVAWVIFWQTQPRIQQAFHRWTAFGVGLLPAVMLQGYLNYFRGSDSPVLPGGIFTAETSVLSRLQSGIPSLHNANYIWAFWIPGKIAGPLFPVRGGGVSPLLLALVLTAFALLLLAFAIYRSALKLTARDNRLVALGLLPAIPLFLWGCMTVSAANYLGDLRYFWPLVPLSVLVAYSIASIRHFGQRRLTGRVLGPIATLYICGYVGVTFVYVFFLFMPGRIGMTERGRLMAGSLDHWPSMAVTHEYSAGRRFVLEQLKEDPNAVLVMSVGGAFYWDPAVDASRVHEADCGGSEPRYFEGPVRILIFTFDEGEADEVWRYSGNSTLGLVSRAACFERLPGRRLLRRFPDERMKLLEASVARGQRISLN
jgi:hypothetical protein